MTTYDTYQEAKIANPSSEIYNLTDEGKYRASKRFRDVVTFIDGEKDSIGVKCRPGDCCMTVERFLADGHKFVEGDLYLNSNGLSIGSVNIPRINNTPRNGDDKLYILRAAALNKPKRTKVGWIKVNDSIFDLRPDFEAGDLYVSHCEGHYEQILSEASLYLACSQGLLYRRVETEIDWRDEVKKLDGSAIFHDDGDLFLIIDSTNDDFISMCHEVAELTDKPTN